VTTATVVEAATKTIDLYFFCKYFILQVFAKPVNYSPVDGIYYSFLTGEIFEAKREGDVVVVSYVNPDLDKKHINLGTFYLQLDLFFYEPLAVYAE
jgi:hypothetical protein